MDFFLKENEELNLLCHIIKESIQKMISKVYVEPIPSFKPENKCLLEASLYKHQLNTLILEKMLILSDKNYQIIDNMFNFFMQDIKRLPLIEMHKAQISVIDKCINEQNYKIQNIKKICCEKQKENTKNNIDNKRKRNDDNDDFEEVLV